jgi:hypothetical protein
MKSPLKLRIVEEPLIDIGALIRADAKSRDWAAVHIRGDRNPPLGFFDRVRRTWR